MAFLRMVGLEIPPVVFHHEELLALQTHCHCFFAVLPCAAPPPGEFGEFFPAVLAGLTIGSMYIMLEMKLFLAFGH